VERASEVLERIVTSFNNQAFVEDGAAEVEGTSPERDHVTILRDAVLTELPHLDEQFLAALNGCAALVGPSFPCLRLALTVSMHLKRYINAASSRENAPLTKLLMSIRYETLRAVASQLPPELQVVELLTQVGDASRKAQILDTAARGGGVLDFLDAAVPGCSHEEVENAASRLVEQMEDTDAVVADIQLLVRTALAREAAREAMHRRRPGPVPVGVKHLDENKVITAAFPPSQLPRLEMALVKELVAVAEPTVRRGLLQFALTQALPLGNQVEVGHASKGGLKPIGSRPPSAGVPWKGKGKEGETGKAGASGGKNSEKREGDGPPPVRPGRLLDCITNLLIDLAVADGANSEAELAEDPVAKRVQAVRRETLLVLEDMAEFKDD
jgi:hypothetical protein